MPTSAPTRRCQIECAAAQGSNTRSWTPFRRAPPWRSLKAQYVLTAGPGGKSGRLKMVLQVGRVKEMLKTIGLCHALQRVIVEFLEIQPDFLALMSMLPHT